MPGSAVAAQIGIDDAVVASQGRQLLADSGFDIITAGDLTDAAEKAVAAAGQS